VIKPNLVAQLTSHSITPLEIAGQRMAEKLLQYYNYIQEQEGFLGKVRLAQLTHIPSVQAAAEPDTPQMVERFKKAIETITGKPAPNL
jgi:hypothetical protein